MPLKKSAGNMYPWVSATHSHLGGECPHKCSYCYVDSPRGRAERYCGPLRLIEPEFNVRYDEKTMTRVCGKYPATIFVEHCNDLFATEVPTEFIQRILAHCSMYPDNTYVLQSKNPIRFTELAWNFPPNLILGTTIESNRHYPDVMGNSPHPQSRVRGMVRLQEEKVKARRFLTIEPVLDFDIDELAVMISRVAPDFLNLGADSKNRHLPEPTVDKIMALVAKLKEYGIELREKHNLQRLVQK